MQDCYVLIPVMERGAFAASSMNSDDLALFLRVAHTGSFSRTSIELGISQPALSRRIAALEAELNTRLFHRNGRGVELTEGGQRLARHAEEITARLLAATSEMSEALSQGPTRIILAAQPTIARILFGSIGKKLKTSYPGTHVTFREGLGGHLKDWLASGEVDAAIMYLPAQAAVSEFDIILRERLSFVASPAYGPLGQDFPVERLAEVPLVLPSRPHGLRMLAESLVARYGQTLTVSMECDASVYITKQLVAEDCGCTILPFASIQDEVQRGILQAVPLAQPAVSRDIGIALPRNRPPIPDHWRVIQAVRQEMIRLVESGHWVDATLA